MNDDIHLEIDDEDVKKFMDDTKVGQCSRCGKNDILRELCSIEDAICPDCVLMETMDLLVRFHKEKEWEKNYGW